MIKLLKNVDGPEKNQSGKKRLQCDSCPYTTTHLGHMKMHIHAVHKKIRNHVCKECGYSASRKSSLNSHIRGVHEKIRNYVCGVCGYAFSQTSNLQNHKRIKGHL